MLRGAGPPRRPRVCIHQPRPDLTPQRASLLTPVYSHRMCRLHAMGIIPTKKSLVQCDKLPTASFCRRRLAVVMVRLKMAETLREAATFIEQVRGIQVWGG